MGCSDIGDKSVVLVRIDGNLWSDGKGAKGSGFCFSFPDWGVLSMRE